MKTKTLQIRGTLTCETEDPPRPLARQVFQRTARGSGNVMSDPERRLQVRAHVIPTNPRTPPQQAHRSSFAAAVAAWQVTSPETRTDAARAGALVNLPAYHYFLSRTLKGLPL